MSKRKKIIILLISLPCIYVICMFLSATLGISEPYLFPAPLRIFPVIPKTIGYRCGSAEYFDFSRDYKVNLPFNMVKEYYQRQMNFYCSNDEDLYISCDESYCFTASCNLQYQFAYMNFNYSFHEPTNVLYSLEISPYSKNAARVEEGQHITNFIPGASFPCP
jgi:hypothetical protein